jgi:chemotaxis signal transduction protein
MFDLHHSSRIHFGLAVPQVAGVLPLDHNRIASAAEVSPELVPYLRGLYDWEGTLLMVLETDAIGACDRW